jgi:hypothetical protein
MTITYKEVTGEFGWEYIERTNEDGSISVIPKDPANSDYQRYLNPEAEQSTPSVIDEPATKSK